jgi:hypothetical protein
LGTGYCSGGSQSFARTGSIVVGWRSLQYQAPAPAGSSCQSRRGQLQLVAIEGDDGLGWASGRRRRAASTTSGSRVVTDRRAFTGSGASPLRTHRAELVATVLARANQVMRNPRKPTRLDEPAELAR